MTNQQAPEIYTLHTVPNKGERPWSGIYTVRADAEHDAKVMRDVTGRDWSVVRLVVADTAATPTGPIARYKIGYATDDLGMRSSTPSGIPDHAGAWVRYEDHLAAPVDAQQPTTHVQNPVGIEHVAGDVSKNGVESNMSQQPAPSSAAADTVVLEAALRAIHQAIDLIGEPDTERLRTVRRVLRGAVVVAEDCKAPQSDSQPAPAGGMAAGWQPIATAPKDGDVLLYSSITQRKPIIDRWHDYCRVNHPQFTHWQPLPAAPSSAGETK